MIQTFLPPQFKMAAFSAKSLPEQLRRSQFWSGGPYNLWFIDRLWSYYLICTALEINYLHHTYKYFFVRKLYVTTYIVKLRGVGSPRNKQHFILCKIKGRLSDGYLGLSLNDRNIVFLVIFLDKTVFAL